MIHAFRAGTHIDSAGIERTITLTDLQATAAAYHPDTHEAPLVVGHPQQDAPAYGWVQDLTTSGDGLIAIPKQVDPEFSELVSAGRFKKVSSSFYTPDSPHNPVPGVYYLRHIGFLGAQPPAVKGLKPIEFADDTDSVTVDFEEVPAWTIADAFRGLREWLLAKFGKEDADAALPSYLVESSLIAAAIPEEPEEMEAESTTETGYEMTQETPTPDFSERERELEARKQQLDELQAKIEKAQADLRKRDLADFADGLVKAGKLLPRDKEGVVAFLASTPSVAVDFGEGKTESSSDWLRKFLESLPARVDFSERTAPASGKRQAKGSDDELRAEFDESDALRAEFGDVETYLAYTKAVGAGRAAVLGSKVQ